MLIIQFGQEVAENGQIIIHKEISFKSSYGNGRYGQIPLMMISTVLSNVKTGAVEYASCDFSTDSIWDWIKQDIQKFKKIIKWIIRKK